MFRRIIGIAGILVVVGVIVMVAISPSANGFFPEMFDFLKHGTNVETGMDAGVNVEFESDSEFGSGVEAGVSENASADSIDRQEIGTCDTTLMN